ncbi:MAG: FG-GAP repeat domain-containing protein [Thermoanaerobaculales bacterium]
MDRKRVITVLLAFGLAATIGWAQQGPSGDGKTDIDAQAETVGSTGERITEEQHQELEKFTTQRFETWEEFLIDWMAPKPVPKKGIVRIDDRFVFPHVAVSYKMEIVREEGETIWLRNLPPDDPQSPIHPIWVRNQIREIGLAMQSEALKQPGAVYFMDPLAEQIPPPFERGLKFEPAAPNLPDSGRWQMNFAIADMNEDGHLDLVFPPQRKSIPPLPAIFLGDGAGGFSLWQDVGWARGVPFDYGGVAVADFNGDGHQDLAIAIHFKAQYVLYGDGQGKFAEFKRLPSPDPRVSSRAVTAADFNGDGRQDLAFVAEIDYDLQTNARISEAATVWVALNGANSWRLETTGLPQNLIADVIRSADMDGDGRPDLVLSSNAVDWRRLVYFNRGSEGWQAAQHRGVLSSAYHYDAVPAEGNVYAVFVQFQMVGGKTTARNGIIRYSVETADKEPVMGTPLVWDKNRADIFFRLGAGDLNGDGLADLVAARKSGGLEVFVQTENKQFVRETADSVFSSMGRAFSVQLADLDGDGLDDIIAGFTPRKDRPGGIYVWLTREAD